MLDVINLAGELRHSIETGNQIHACLALHWDETKDETPLEKQRPDSGLGIGGFGQESALFLAVSRVIEIFWSSANWQKGFRR